MSRQRRVPRRRLRSLYYARRRRRHLQERAATRGARLPARMSDALSGSLVDALTYGSDRFIGG